MRRTAEETERILQRTALLIQDRFGKNALLKGMNFLECGTARDRNTQIGSYRAGEEDD